MKRKTALFIGTYTTDFTVQHKQLVYQIYGENRTFVDFIAGDNEGFDASFLSFMDEQEFTCCPYSLWGARVDAKGDFDRYEIGESICAEFPHLTQSSKRAHTMWRELFRHLTIRLFHDADIIVVTLGYRNSDLITNLTLQAISEGKPVTIICP